MPVDNVAELMAEDGEDLVAIRRFDEPVEDDDGAAGQAERVDRVSGLGVRRVFVVVRCGVRFRFAAQRPKLESDGIGRRGAQRRGREADRDGLRGPGGQGARRQVVLVENRQ